MKYFLHSYKNFLNFSGRASKKEFWFFVLFHILFVLITIELDALFNTMFHARDFGIIFVSYCVSVILPAKSLIVRRLHDVGKDASYSAVLIIPVAGLIWFVVLMLKDSTEGENKYGPEPVDL